MPSNCAQLVFIYIFYGVFIHNSLQCPKIMPEIAKAGYKSGEISDMANTPVTIDKIKKKMEDMSIFNFSNASLTDTEKKELGKLFDAVEIMTTSRYRQPTSAQTSMFSALRIVERAVKKQLKEGQISEALAAKFNWEGLGGRQRPLDSEAKYYYDKKKNMRVFIVSTDDDDSPK